MTLVVVLGGVLALVLPFSGFQALGKFQTLKILHKLVPRHLVDIDVRRQHRHLPFGWFCVIEYAAQLVLGEWGWSSAVCEPSSFKYRNT